MLIEVDPEIFVPAGIKKGTVFLFSKKALPEWPKNLAYHGKVFNFEGLIEVPTPHKDQYLGAAEYLNNTKCIYNEAWQGRCNKDCVGGTDYCDKHTEKTCAVCGDQSDHNCDATMGLVCGTPLCSKKMCKVKHKSGHMLPKKIIPIDHRVGAERWFANDIQYSELTEEEFNELAEYHLKKPDDLIALYQNLHDGAGEKGMREDETEEDFQQRIVDTKKRMLDGIQETKDQHIYLTDLISRIREVRALDKTWEEVYGPK